MKAESRIVVEDLEFLSFDSKVGYFRRHKLNFQLRRALKKALKEDLPIVAANEEVARGLHRFYYVPVDRIQLR